MVTRIIPDTEPVYGTRRHLIVSSVVLSFYVLLSIIGVAMAGGLFLPELVYTDPANQFPSDQISTDVLVPFHLYLFSSLGALAWVFFIMWRTPNMLEGNWRDLQDQLLRAGFRVPLALLLVTGMYLLTKILGFQFSATTLAGVSFLIGLFVKEALMLFDAAGERLFEDGNEATKKDFYFGVPDSESVQSSDDHIGVTKRGVIGGVALVTIFLALTVGGVLMSTGLLFPEVVFGDPSSTILPDGVAIDIMVPPYMYLFGFLGALAYIFDILAFSPNYYEKEVFLNEIKLASIRILLAVLLVTGLYLLTSTLGFAFSDRSLAGISFLVGIYAKETIAAFYGIAQRVFNSKEERQRDICERCETEQSHQVIVEGEGVCLDCLTDEERAPFPNSSS